MVRLERLFRLTQIGKAHILFSVDVDDLLGQRFTELTADHLIQSTIIVVGLFKVFCRRVRAEPFSDGKCLQLPVDKNGRRINLRLVDKLQNLFDGNLLHPQPLHLVLVVIFILS